jgi:hypothetical protein
MKQIFALIHRNYYWCEPQIPRGTMVEIKLGKMTFDDFILAGPDDYVQVLYKDKLSNFKKGYLNNFWFV